MDEVDVLQAVVRAYEEWEERFYKRAAAADKTRRPEKAEQCRRAAQLLHRARLQELLNEPPPGLSEGS